MKSRKKQEEEIISEEAVMIKSIAEREMRKLQDKEFSKRIMFILLCKEQKRIEEDVQLVEKTYNLLIWLLIENDYHRAVRYLFMFELFIDRLLKNVECVYKMCTNSSISV